MNQHDQIRVGNLVTLRTLTARDVWPRTSNGDLTGILQSFNLADLVITLARINLYLQRTEDIFACDQLLKSKFCSRYLRHKIERHGLDKHIIFNRRSTLRLLSESVSIAEPGFTLAPSAIIDVNTELGKCYLMANGLSDVDPIEFESELTDEQRKESLVELMPSLEYAIYSSPRHLIKKSLVRSEKLIARLQHADLKFDVDKTFFKASGLTLHEYQHLIYGILCVPLTYLPAEISGGTVGFIDTKPSPKLGELYDMLLQHACISINELAHEAKKTPSLSNEFRLWRKYPLVKITDKQIVCVDIGFLMDKLDTGLFWILRDRLKSENKGKENEIFRFRGTVFEDYAASIIKRGIDSQIPSRRETCIVKPVYNQKEDNECSDIAVCGDETLILLECKAHYLSAKAKFSHDLSDLQNVIKSKIIAPRGKNQLWDAIRSLAHADKTKRREVKGINICRVKKIFPVLVLSDRIFSLPFMNGYFDSEFRRFVRYKDLRNDLEITRLTVLTIDNLEDLEPYLCDSPLYVHLDKWLQVFDRNKSYPFSQYLLSLGQKRKTPYVEQEFKQIHSSIMEFFSAHGLKK